MKSNQMVDDFGRTRFYCEYEDFKNVHRAFVWARDYRDARCVAGEIFHLNPSHYCDIAIFDNYNFDEIKVDYPIAEEIHE